MSKNVTLVVILFGFLSGCVSLVDTRIIPDESLRVADVYTLKTSNWKFSANRFDQEFGFYTISESYQSWTSSDNDVEIVDSKTRTNLITSLVFGQEEYSTFEVDQSIFYGFNLHNNEESLQIKCAIFSLNHQQRTTRYTSKPFSSTEKGDLYRKNTNLSCQILNEPNNDPFFFSVEISPNGEYRTKFKATNKLKEFTLKTVRDFEYTYSNGSKKHSSSLLKNPQNQMNKNIRYDLQFSLPIL